MYTHSVQLIIVNTNSGLSSWLGPKPCCEVEGKKKASPVQTNKLKRPLKPPEELIVTVEAVPIITVNPVPIITVNPPTYKL